MKRSTVCILPIVIAGFGTNLRAQPTPVQSSIETQLDRYVAPLRDLQVFSGTIVVAQGDRILLERSYGLASLEHETPIRTSTRFRIASVSKPFTRVLVGRLSERGVLALDDRVSRWLPSFRSAEKITIRMLLDHRGGVPDINSLPYDEEALEPNSLARLVDSIAKRPLDFEPGTRRSYSNGGYAILARIVEIATRERFGAILDREILQPLGLASTRHEADGMIVRGLASGYMPSPEVPGVMVRAPFQEMDTKQGGGSMVSSARDLIRFVRAIGRSGLLSDSTWTELFPTKDSALAYSGRSPGFNAFVAHDRKRDITTVILANNYSASMVDAVASGAESIVMGRKPEPLPVVSPIKEPPAEMARLAGYYAVPDGVLPVPAGTVVELRSSGDHIVAYLGSVPVDVLVPQGNGAYLARALWSIIQVQPTGPVNSIRVRALYRDSEFTATRLK